MHESVFYDYGKRSSENQLFSDIAVHEAVLASPGLLKNYIIYLHIFSNSVYL